MSMFPQRPATWVLASLMLASALVAPVHAQDGGALEGKQVEKSIELGIQYLQRQQDARGEWVEWAGFEGGTIALCTLSLLSAGVPANDPSVTKALESIRRRAKDPKRVYVVSLEVMALCAARNRKDMEQIKSHALWLQNAQSGSGGWGYSSPPSGPGDPSNSQFALLALHEAERFDPRIASRINESTWRKALKYWEDSQNPSGSWGYKQGDGGSGSMTCAGISSVVIASGKISADPAADETQFNCCGNETRNARVDRALVWLGDNYSVTVNPGQGGFLSYYLYGLERAGRLTAQRFLVGKTGKPHDWYRDGAMFLVSKQDQISGNWKGLGDTEAHPNIATSLALLFMGKGRRPVLMSKLKYAAGMPWNQHPEDVANLTAYIEGKWDRELAWQIVDPRTASVDDLLQSPILYMNGRDAFTLPPEAVKRLKGYIEQGGFIFAEACCDGKEFDQSFRKLVDAMFAEAGAPGEAGERRLLPLAPDHAVWRTEEVVPENHRTDLWGVNISCRTSIIYSAKDLSCGWHHASPRRMQKLNAGARIEVDASLAIGHNVVAYATNRELKYKYQNFDIKSEEPNKYPRGELNLALVRHSGGSDAAPEALPNLRRALAKVKNVYVNFNKKDVGLAEEAIFDFPVLFMHGRHNFTLSESERKQLLKYTERGGVLVCDSVCGSESFARAFRREMEAIFGEGKLEKIPVDHPLFTDKYGGSNLKTVTRREPIRVAPDKPLETMPRQVEPQLLGVKLGDRYVVIFSEFDISCAMENHSSPECRGYVHEDALKLGVNAVLYSLYQPGP